MRIVLLSDRIPPENRGGAGEMAWRLALGLQQAGQDVHVISATAGTPFEDLRQGIPTYHLHSRYPERWRAWLSLVNPQTLRPLRALLGRLRPDIVHAHNIHSDLGYIALAIAHGMGIPTLFTSHDVMPFAYQKVSHFVRPELDGIQDARAYRLPPFYNLRQNRLRYNPLRNVVIRHMLARHALIRLTPSAELARAHSANGLPPFEALHNGIDPQAWQVEPEQIAALRQRLNLGQRPVILFAGRLTPAKGTHVLLSALEQVVERLPDAMVLVLSPQPIHEQIREARWQALAQAHLRSGGWLSGTELAAAYHLAQVVVVPSMVFDTFPTVILEAMACAKPVIASCWGGAREVVQDGQTGYILNPQHTSLFAERLTRLLSDTALAQAMGQAGYARLQDGFTQAQFVAKTLETYERARAML